MTITVQDIITVAAVLAAVFAIVGYYNKAYKWVHHQQAQDKAISELKDEQTLIVYGVLASLKGLKEQGCNGPVSEAINKIEKHLNQKAHQWEEV